VEAALPAASNKAPSVLLTHALMALLCVVWSSTWLVIKVGLTDVPPFTGAALRFAIAGIVMAALVAVLGSREGGERPPAIAVWSHGLCQFALNYGLVYVAETMIPSGLVAVLWSVFPLFVGLGGHFVLRIEVLSPRKWLGIAIAFCGVATLFVTDFAAIDARAVQMGLLVLLAPLGVSFSTLVIKQRASGASSLVLNRDAMLIGTVVLAAIALATESPSELRMTPAAIFSVLYLALVGSVLTFGVYLWLLRYVPAYKMSLVSFVVPPIALLLGALFGGESLTAHTLLGAAIVLLGVGLVIVQPRKSIVLKK
jgi:drug/metabolite transporter (DMT)-like permease